MIERIVAAYDGSELGKEAFACALAMARAAGLPVHARRVLEPPTPLVGPSDPIGVLDPSPMPVTAPDPSEIAAELEAERRKGEKELSALERECAGVPFSYSLHEGLLVETLTDTASATEVLAVGKKGRFARGGLGSGTRSLMRHSPCPVLVVSGTWTPTGRIVAAFDGSSASKRAVAAAREIAQKTGWGLVLAASATKERSAEETRDWAGGFAPEAQGVVVGEAGSRAERVAVGLAGGEESGALVAMGAYHESLVHDLILGSTTAGAMEAARSPVMLVH